MTGPRSSVPSSAPAKALAFALAGLLVVGLYWKSLPFPFVLDDLTNLVKNPALRIRPLDPVSFFGSFEGVATAAKNRPVALYSFAINHGFGGLDPWGYRLVNVLIHIGCIGMVFGLVSVSSRRAFGRAPCWIIPFACALLWAVHPVHTSAVVYVVQREASLAALFYFGAFLSYAAARSRQGAGSAGWFAVSAVLYALACGTKEIAYVLPLALILFECAFSEGLRTWLRRRPWAAVAFLGAAASLFPWALYHYGAGYAAYPFDWRQRVLTELRVVSHYLGLLALPHPSRLVFDYNFVVSQGLLAPPTTILSLALHATLLAVGGWALVARPLYGFAVLGFYLHLAMESTVIPLDLVFEHRLYVPSVFLFVGAAGIFEEPGVRRFLRGRRATAAAAAGVCLVAVWAGWTYRRLDAWRDPLTLWSDALEKQPGNLRALNNLGNQLAERGRVEEAIARHLEALRVNPHCVEAQYNVANDLAQSGRTDEALPHFAAALRLNPNDPGVHDNLGLVLAEAGRYREAEQQFLEAIRLNPNLVSARNNLGVLLAEQGRRGEAMLHFQKTLRLQAGYANGRENLAALLRN